MTNSDGRAKYGLKLQLRGFNMERIVESEGCNLSYKVRGTGPAVLLIQGVGVQGDGWQPQIEELASEYTCISFDNRGIGKSQPTTRVISVEQLADDALAILDAEKIASAHIVGHSLGGLIALQLALSSKERVLSLSLMCTFPSGVMVAPLTMRMIWLGMRSQLGTRRMRRRGFIRLVLPPGRIKNLDETAERLATLFGHDLGDQPKIVRDQLRVMRASNVSSRLGELTNIPTMVVSACHDPIAPPRAGMAIRDGIRGSRYFEIEN
ncbi:MAG TPA: alpha/beta hydrolase, partial [Pirellula sp.]|nr:alpha/beta hydrolase [Pirellula sp.]